MNPQNGPFYRKPLLSVLGFRKQCVGINTLSTYMKQIFSESDTDMQGRRIVNHSGRVTREPWF